MLKKLISLGAAAVASLTAACQDGPASVAGWRSPAAWSSMVYATSHGPMLVQVLGQPFDGTGPDGGGSRAEFRHLVAEAMGRQVFSRPFDFTLDPSQAPQPQLRVILAFNAPANLDSRRLCRGEAATASDVREKITLHAVFCEHETLLASAEGWVARVQGPQDARFRQLLAQITRDLFGNGS